MFKKLAFLALLIPLATPTVAHAQDYFTSTDDRYKPSNVSIINVMNRVMHSPDFMYLTEGQTEVIHGRTYTSVAEEGDSASAEGVDNEKTIATAKDIMSIGKDALNNATANTNGIYNNNYANNPYWSRDLSSIAGLTEDMMNRYKDQMNVNWRGLDTKIHNYDDIRDTFAMNFALSQAQWNKLLDNIRDEWGKMTDGLPMYGYKGKYNNNPVGGVDTSDINQGAGSQATGVPVDNITVKNDVKQNIDTPANINYPLWIGYSSGSNNTRNPANNLSGYYLVSPSDAELAKSEFHSYRTKGANTIVDYDRWRSHKAYMFIDNNETAKKIGNNPIGRWSVDGASGTLKEIRVKTVYENRNLLAPTEREIDVNRYTPVKITETAKEEYDKLLDELNKKLLAAKPEEQPAIQEEIVKIQNEANQPINAEIGDTKNAQGALSDGRYPTAYRFNNLPTADLGKLAADLFKKFGYTFDPRMALDLLNGTMSNFNIPIDFNGLNNAVNDIKSNFSMLSNGLTPYGLNYINSQEGYNKYKKFIDDFYFKNRFGIMNQDMRWSDFFPTNEPYINVSAIKEVNLKQIRENMTYYSNFNNDFLWRIYDSSGKEVGVYETGAPELYIMAGKPDTYTVEQFQRADVYLATVKSYRIRYYIFSPITNTLLASWEDADEKVFPQDGTHSTAWVKVWDGTYQTHKGRVKIKKNSDLWDTQQIR